VRDSVPADRTEADRYSGVPPEAAVRSLAREVVERLSRARATTAEAPPDEVALFCAALSGSEPQQADRLARAALEAGLSFDQLCETYLAPAARRLGTLWEADEMSFAEVTLAANRLFGLLRRLAHRPAPRADSPFVVFAAPPGEEHILGISMAAERARGAGWDVVLHLGLDHDTLVERIAESAPDVIGLSLSSRRALLPMTRLVVALRVTIPAAPIVLSGPGVAEVQQPLPGVDVMTPHFDAAMAAMARLAS
jgi:MerR family transcriptional regulator, light-induced transcriptional regulator